MPSCWLGAADVSYLVLGPDCCAAALRTVDRGAACPSAKNAKLVQLESGFQMDDAEKAAAELLQKIGRGSRSLSQLFTNF